MASVGVYEAKTHLPKLLERVERGEKITITRRGKPIAELVPSRDAPVRASIADEFREIREGVKPDPEGWTIRDYINLGRR